MQTTSHFIGIKLKNELFVKLFVRLQQALGSRTNALEFQNILSTHITLFYLPQELSSHDGDKIQDIIQHLNISLLEYGLKKFEYFGNIDTPRLCYFIPNTNQPVIWNELFKKALPEYLDIPDNRYPIFIPHITLFKIRDIKIFLSMREILEKILGEELEKLTSKNIIDHVCVFAVNSNFHPEIQMEIS